MADNEIKVTFVGGEPAGGAVNQTDRPAGSSQDTSRSAAPDMRPNFDLDELFGVASTAQRPTYHTDATDPPQRRRMEKEEEARNAEIQEESDRRQRVQQGLERQRQQEEDRRNKVLSDLASQRVKEEAKAAKQEEDERQKRNRVLSGLADQKVKEEARQAKEEDEERKKRNRVLSSLAAQRVKEEEKTAKEAKAADKEQRDKMMQAGQAVQQLAGAKTAGGKASGLTNLASSGVLGEEAAALAGGPVGAAVMAVSAIQDAVEGIIKEQGAAQREAIQKAGNIGGAVIGNDYGAAANEVSEGVAGALEKAGIAGTILAEQLRTATAAANTFGQVVDAAARRGKELSGFSSSIAAAEAMADVRKLRRDIEEAQRNEGSYSRIIDSQSRIEDTTRAVFDPIKDAFLESLADVLEPIADVAQDLKPVLRAVSQTIALFIKLDVALGTIPLKTLAAVIDLAFGWLGGKNDEPPNLLTELDRAVENLRNGQAGRQPQQNEVDRPNKVKKPKFFGGGV